MLSQDEAWFPMVPTLCRRLGVKGHRPVVGTWDNKQLLDVFASVNVLACALHTHTVKSRTRRLQRAFADSLRRLARRYPNDTCARVVILSDNAPWHPASRSPGSGPSTRTESGSASRAPARSST